MWPSGGVPVYTLFPAFAHPWIEADGSGGAFIAWDDKRTSWANPDNVYMQRVDATGNMLWQTNGVPVMDSTATVPYMFPRVMADGAGGAYVAFRGVDNISYPNNGWATGMLRILGDGTRAWPTAFIDVYGDSQPQQTSFDMTVPPDGGILWAGSQGGDLAAFRLDAQGAGAWNGTPGVPVSARDVVSEQRPSVSVDSSGVTHVLFSRSQFVNDDSLFAYQLDASGTVIDSTHVNSGTYVFPERADVTSLSDGAVYGWVDKRNGESDVFARMPAPVSTGVTAGATPPIAHLSANWPNPFSIDTRFDYTLDATTRVDLAVYDVAGRRVRTLATGPRGSGAHRAAWDGADAAGHHVASGVYFVRLRAGGRTAVRRMTVVR